jgi:hypothetical protein
MPTRKFWLFFFSTQKSQSWIVSELCMNLDRSGMSLGDRYLLDTVDIISLARLV